mmetsp:Transcript_9437/g.14477  ORF Transcript_9437/g.14477 Transcript_9437/m.14477 type:complete len:264 (-) Transcript_9437:64-855(-)|eukprot:CAMPEP_0170487832 /NCGR_PEP_ID=MMETSP0208-20121228/6554_1 /TAXON_ID=197538 /ORGANISM="Strombidium inclinatum, Strain S3" /LENGTH=263 /DNA_ID=CAMNT_0010762241 /DNA_START=100 /DNA_END=891 /DNA_ORIENTATION=+
MSSDGDDWENQLDSDNEENATKKVEEAKKKFDDEDVVDPEEVARKKKEEAKKQADEAAANARVKKTNKVDYDKLYEERQAKVGNAPAKKEAASAEETKGMSKAAKGIVQEQEAEKNLVDQLFADEMDEEGQPCLQLKSEEEYKGYGQKVGKVLFNGSAHYRVPLFYTELSKELASNCDSRQIKKIADHLLSLYNEKLRKEKDEQKGKQKKKKEKPSIKGGGAKGYERNNNTAMLQDVMGEENANDGYGDEYGDYGDETPYTRE